jgi:hypothetical protein
LLELLKRLMILFEHLMGRFILDSADRQKLGLGLGHQDTKGDDQVRIDFGSGIGWLVL